MGAKEVRVKVGKREGDGAVDTWEMIGRKWPKECASAHEAMPCLGTTSPSVCQCMYE
jgi:hypothetical protein